MQTEPIQSNCRKGKSPEISLCILRISKYLTTSQSREISAPRPSFAFRQRISSSAGVRISKSICSNAAPPTCIMGCRRRFSTATSTVAVPGPDSHNNEIHPKQSRRQGLSAHRRRRRRRHRGRTQGDGDKLPRATTPDTPSPIIEVHFRVNVGRVPSCEETMKHLNSTAPSGWSVQKVSYDTNIHLFTASVMITNAQEWDSISMRDRHIQLGNIALQPFMRCSGCNKLGKNMLLCGACKSVTYCGEDCQKDHWTDIHREQCQKAALN